MFINFNSLQGIIRDKTTKYKDAKDSVICLNEFINLEENIIQSNRIFKQDESANFIMSLQNWLQRKNYTTCHQKVDIGDIFYTDLGINYKPEFSYHHPVIILEEVGSLVLVVPVSTSNDNITTAYHPIDNPTGSKYMRKVYGKDKGIDSDGFEKTGAVLLSDVKTISKGRLISKKGRMKDINDTNSVFKEIKKSIFTLCFPKENIKLFKATLALENKTLEYDSLIQEHKTLQDEYNKLKESLSQSQQNFK